MKKAAFPRSDVERLDGIMLLLNAPLTYSARSVLAVEASVHRVLSSVAILFLAAACSGTSGSTSGAAQKAAADIDPAMVTPEYVASLPRDQAKAAMSSLTQRYLRLAWEPCTVADDDCLSKQLEASLDPSGELATLCKVNGNGKEYHVCLLSAPVTVPMVTAAGGNPATDIEWPDVDSTNNAARKQFLEFIVKEKCGSDDIPCIVGQAATLLGLSPTVAKSCQLHRSPSDQMNCISDAQDAEVLQRAIRTLS